MQWSGARRDWKGDGEWVAWGEGKEQDWPFEIVGGPQRMKRLQRPRHYVTRVGVDDEAEAEAEP